MSGTYDATPGTQTPQQQPLAASPSSASYRNIERSQSMYTGGGGGSVPTSQSTRPRSGTNLDAVTDPHNQLPMELQEVLGSTVFHNPQHERRWEEAWVGNIPLSVMEKDWCGESAPILSSYGFKAVPVPRKFLNWKRRFFVLAPPFVFYFESDHPKSTCRGAIYLDGAEIKEEKDLQDNRNVIEIHPRVQRKPEDAEKEKDPGSFRLSFEGVKLADKWLQALKHFTTRVVPKRYQQQQPANYAMQSPTPVRRQQPTVASAPLEDFGDSIEGSPDVNFDATRKPQPRGNEQPVPFHGGQMVDPSVPSPRAVHGGGVCTRCRRKAGEAEATLEQKALASRMAKERSPYDVRDLLLALFLKDATQNDLWALMEKCDKLPRAAAAPSPAPTPQRPVGRGIVSPEQQDRYAYGSSEPTHDGGDADIRNALRSLQENQAAMTRMIAEGGSPQRQHTPAYSGGGSAYQTGASPAMSDRMERVKARKQIVEQMLQGLPPSVQGGSALYR